MRLNQALQLKRPFTGKGKRKVILLLRQHNATYRENDSGYGSEFRMGSFSPLDVSYNLTIYASFCIVFAFMISKRLRK